MIFRGLRPRKIIQLRKPYPFWLTASILLLVGLTSCSKPADTADRDASLPAATTETASTDAQAAPDLVASSATSGRDLTPLFSHVWRVTAASSEPAPGSIY
ncbi:MAG: hypothetical protein D6742_08100, partial [Cyanobacteria bacterium J069]